MMRTISGFVYHGDVDSFSTMLLGFFFLWRAIVCALLRMIITDAIDNCIDAKTEYSIIKHFSDFTNYCFYSVANVA